MCDNPLVLVAFIFLIKGINSPAPMEQAPMELSFLLGVARHRDVYSRAAQSRRGRPGVNRRRSEYRGRSTRALSRHEWPPSIQCSCRDMLWLPRYAYLSQEER